MTSQSEWLDVQGQVLAAVDALAGSEAEIVAAREAVSRAQAAVRTAKKTAAAAAEAAKAAAAAVDTSVAGVRTWLRDDQALRVAAIRVTDPDLVALEEELTRLRSWAGMIVASVSAGPDMAFCTALLRLGALADSDADDRAVMVAEAEVRSMEPAARFPLTVFAASRQGRLLIPPALEVDPRIATYLDEADLPPRFVAPAPPVTAHDDLGPDQDGGDGGSWQPPPPRPCPPGASGPGLPLPPPAEVLTPDAVAVPGSGTGTGTDPTLGAVPGDRLRYRRQHLDRPDRATGVAVPQGQLMTLASAPKLRLQQPANDGAALRRRPRQYSVRRDVCFLWLFLLMVATNLTFAAGVYLPWLSPALGGLFVLAVPTLLLYGAEVVPAHSRSERLAVSAVLTLLGLMVTGLAVNTVLPMLGVRDPLGALPAVATVDLLVVALGAWARRRHPATYAFGMPALGHADQVVLGLGGLVLVLAVVGAVRLNNGAGGGVTLVMLLVGLVEGGLLLAWRDRLSSGVVSVAVYGLSLSLLLMTSLRGWYTTGHDVQRELRVFELTKVHGNWSMARFRDAYNACLSVTILPTLISRWTRVDDPYVYKFFYQVLFALCPVLLLNLAKRMMPLLFSLLAVLYFMSFVTFFQDMPMLNRQEMAFLFLAAGLLALFNDRLSVRHRRRWSCVFAAGMVLSHYSTTYVAVGVLALAWFAGKMAPPILAALSRVAPGLAGRATIALDPGARRSIVTIGPVVVLAVMAAVWTGPVTHTEAGLSKTMGAAIEGLRGGNAASKSSDTSYSIFSVGRVAPVRRLADYKGAAVRATARERAAGAYYPDQLVSRYPTPVAAAPKLPLTPVGRALTKVGVDVAALNYVVRQVSARILQLLAVIGLVVVLFSRRPTIRPPPEYVLLAIGSILVVFLQVVLPVLSVDYGLLRAFQQSLLVLDVFLVTGSLALLGPRAPRRGVGAASLLVLALLASSTGVFTQLLGGYGPQLHLNNAGTYYDIYYLHPQEISGIAWLRANTPAGVQGNVQSEIQTDRYTFTRIQTLIPLNRLNDIYPSLVRRNSYVFLGFSTLTTGNSTVPFSGDLTTYHYPLAFLDDNKDLIYSNAGSRVYR